MAGTTMNVNLNSQFDLARHTSDKNIDYEVKDLYSLV